eukprot:8846388-Ditylum_brightwellii.AAC.2
MDDVKKDLSIWFGNKTTERVLKQKDPSDSIAQLGVKNNPSVEFRDYVNDRHATSNAVTTRLK